MESTARKSISELQESFYKRVSEIFVTDPSNFINPFIDLSNKTRPWSWTDHHKPRKRIFPPLPRYIWPPIIARRLFPVSQFWFQGNAIDHNTSDTLIYKNGSEEWHFFLQHDIIYFLHNRYYRYRLRVTSKERNVDEKFFRFFTRRLFPKLFPGWPLGGPPYIFDEFYKIIKTRIDSSKCILSCSRTPMGFYVLTLSYQNIIVVLSTFLILK